MKNIFLLFILLILRFQLSAQCNYVWAQWHDQGRTDTAVGSILVNGATINMRMMANYGFDFTPNIYNYPAYFGFSDIPVNDTVPRTTWASGAAGTSGITTICFSPPVVDPVLLLSSVGSGLISVSLDFSSPFNVLFDGGGNTFISNTSLSAHEGYSIVEFPGTISCITILSNTPENYTNLTWGVKNPLTANFTYTNNCQNNTIAFSSSTSSINSPGTLIAYHWDFGDNTASSQINPSHSYISPGIYHVELVVTADNLCTDTISKLVTIYPAYNNIHSVNLCTGQSYNINSHNYSTSGIYRDTLSTIMGCDSIVVTLLTINSNGNFMNPQTICGGGNYSINSHIYTVSGNYFDTLTTAIGCDSIVNTLLTVRSAFNSTNLQTVCGGGNYSLNNHVYSSTGNYYDTLTTVYGCDSIVNTQLTVLPLYTASNPQSVCQGETYLFNSHVYNSNGIYYDTLSSVSGCDSIVLTSLTVNSVPVITFLHPADVCIEADELDLNFASPSGGIYNGQGVTNNIFNPQTASVGTHPLTYIYTDPLTNCMNSAQENITVHPSPVAKLSVNPELANLSDSKISFADLSQGIVTSQWDFGDGFYSTDNRGEHLYQDTGHFQVTLTVTDIFGCSNFADITVYIDGEFSFYVPNAFTPDGDGINDYFSGTGVGVGEYSMIIFNRWGEEIFKTTDLKNPWSGKNVQDDSYVYRINLVDAFGGNHEYVGKVSLVR